MATPKADRIALFRLVVNAWSNTAREVLKPTEEDQTKPAELADIDALIAESTSPQFVADCESFREQFQPGDEIVEFCASLSSWQNMMGR